ncbi:MAG: hypothetical protein K9M07_04455 [Simkaniaceae bacterium]|nr:hypothetical protein [Simkaniaceae bacterium]
MLGFVGLYGLLETGVKERFSEACDAVQDRCTALWHQCSLDDAHFYNQNYANWEGKVVSPLTMKALEAFCNDATDSKTLGVRQRHVVIDLTRLDETKETLEITVDAGKTAAYVRNLLKATMEDKKALGCLKTLNATISVRDVVTVEKTATFMTGHWSYWLNALQLESKVTPQFSLDAFGAAFMDAVNRAAKKRESAPSTPTSEASHVSEARRSGMAWLDAAGVDTPRDSDVLSDRSDDASPISLGGVSEAPESDETGLAERAITRQVGLVAFLTAAVAIAVTRA